MSDFFKAETLVFLRSDPTQYGRIGTNPTGALCHEEAHSQDVFWEHPGADIVSCVRVEDLMDEQEMRARRRSFMAAIRQPGTEVLRRALWNMRWDKDHDWRSIAINEAEIWNDRACWQLVTDKYQIYTFDGQEFYFEWMHQADMVHCPCEICE